MIGGYKDNKDRVVESSSFYGGLTYLKHYHLSGEQHKVYFEVQRLSLDIG